MIRINEHQIAMDDNTTIVELAKLREETKRLKINATTFVIGSVLIAGTIITIGIIAPEVLSNLTSSIVAKTEEN